MLRKGRDPGHSCRGWQRSEILSTPRTHVRPSHHAARSSILVRDGAAGSANCRFRRRSPVVVYRRRPTLRELPV